MVIFVAPYIIPVTMINKETHTMDKLIHDGKLTPKGQQELIQIIKKNIEIIEQNKSLKDKEEEQYFDSIKIIPRKKDYKLTSAVAFKSLYQFSFSGEGDSPLTWRRVYISFEQDDEHIKTFFSVEDFKALDLTLEAILLYKKGIVKADSDVFYYVASLKDNPKITIIFCVDQYNFKRLDHFPRNFYSIIVSKNNSGTYEYPNAQTLYLNKK